MPSRDKIIFGYVLCDPLTSAVRYVGITQCLEKRYRRHLKPDHNDLSMRARWIRELKSTELEPVMRIIGQTSFHCAGEAERWWMQSYSDCDLVNGTDGGSVGMSPTDEVRKRISESVKKAWTPELRAKASARKKGQPPAYIASDEVKAKIREGLRLYRETHSYPFPPRATPASIANMKETVRLKREAAIVAGLWVKPCLGGCGTMLPKGRGCPPRCTSCASALKRQGFKDNPETWEARKVYLRVYKRAWKRKRREAGLSI